MSNAQQRIDEIENRRPAEVEEPEIVHGPPRFTSQFQQPPQLREGALFHVDAQLEPVGDNARSCFYVYLLVFGFSRLQYNGSTTENRSGTQTE